MAKKRNTMRLLAEYLEERDGAPSLDGYDLIPGLLAAADLLDDEDGPEIHDDLDGPYDSRSLDDIPRLTLRALMDRVLKSDG